MADLEINDLPSSEDGHKNKTGKNPRHVKMGAVSGALASAAIATSLIPTSAPQNYDASDYSQGKENVYKIDIPPSTPTPAGITIDSPLPGYPYKTISAGLSAAGETHLAQRITEVENAAGNSRTRIIKETLNADMNVFFAVAEGNSSIKEVYANPSSPTAINEINAAANVGEYLAWANQGEKSPENADIALTDTDTPDDIVAKTRTYLQRVQQGKDLKFTIYGYEGKGNEVKPITVDPSKQLLYVFSGDAQGKRSLSFNEVDGILIIEARNYGADEVGIAFTHGLATMSDRTVQNRMRDTQNGEVHLSGDDTIRMNHLARVIYSLQNGALQAQ